MNRHKKDRCKAQHLGPIQCMMQRGNLLNKELCVKLSAGFSVTGSQCGSTEQELTREPVLNLIA